MQLPSTGYSKWIHKIKSIWKSLYIVFSNSYPLKTCFVMWGWKALEAGEAATVRTIASSSLGGHKDLCSAQVSSEEPSCCQLPALASSLGRALMKSGLAGKCMLQALFRAEKTSRAGLVKLALMTSISGINSFKFHSLIWFLLCFFLCLEDFFKICEVFYAMLTIQ